jgi:preprotein translocase subunit SecD
MRAARCSVPTAALRFALAVSLGAVLGCGAAFTNVSKPGTAKLEFRLVAKSDAGGYKVPTWDGKSSMVVEQECPLTDRDVESVKLARLPNGTPAINLQLDQTASITLESVTSKNRGRRLAVIVDGKIVIAPTIKETITGGHMTIGGFNDAATTTIYNKLKK